MISKRKRPRTHDEMIGLVSFEEDEIMGETPIEEQLQVEFGIFEPRPEDESTIRAILNQERPVCSSASAQVSGLAHY